MMMIEDYETNQTKPLSAGQQHNHRTRVIESSPIASAPDLPPPTYRCSNVVNFENNPHHHRNQQQQQQQQNYYKLSRKKVFISEFIGTFLFVYLAQSTLTSFELIGTQNDMINRQLATILTYGLAFLLATLLTLNLSGAHLNPAYTLASAIFKHTHRSALFSYIIAQYLGSFLASCLLHITYSDKLTQRHLEGSLLGANSTLKAHGNILSTGKLFSSFPPTEVSLGQLFIAYLLANSIFSMSILSIHQSKLIKIPRHIKPIYLSLTLVLIQAAFSANGGPVLNPAQDFSPRLYISLFGWGTSAFNLYRYEYWWLCGIVAPHLGALFGFGIYQILIYANNLQDKTTTTIDVNN